MIYYFLRIKCEKSIKWKTLYRTLLHYSFIYFLANFKTQERIEKEGIEKKIKVIRILYKIFYIYLIYCNVMARTWTCIINSFFFFFLFSVYNEHVYTAELVGRGLTFLSFIPQQRRSEIFSVSLSGSSWQLIAWTIFHLDNIVLAGIENYETVFRTSGFSSSLGYLHFTVITLLDSEESSCKPFPRDL